MKKTIMIKSFGLFMIFILSAFSFKNNQPPQMGNWRFLGKVVAGKNLDHDVIYVPGPYDFYRKLKFKVSYSPINIYRMVVTYENGMPDKIDVRSFIPKGGESRVIDLKGDRRKLKKVEFWYNSKGVIKGKSVISLFGMR